MAGRINNKMPNDKNNRYGKEFEKAWTEGMKNNDWSFLNDVIVKSVDNFLDGVGDRMNDALASSKNVSPNAVPLSQRREDFSGNTQTANMQRKLHEERRRVREEMERQRREREAARRSKRLAKRGEPTTQLAFPYNNSASAMSTVNCIIGGIGTGFTGLWALVRFVSAGLTLSNLFFPVALVGVFALVLGKGVRQGKMATLANRYVEIIGKRQYIDISTLALSANKSERKVLRELKKLLSLGYFPQGHIDRDGKTFILTDEVFNHYLELETHSSSNVIDTTARSEDEQEFPELPPEESAELSRMIREGNDHISRIRALNNDIPGIEISAKLDRLEGLLKEIFARIREHPEQMSRIHELMDYYLPTSVKLVDAYREYDRVSEPGREILEAKRDIENTMDTINDALGKLLNKLFKDSVLDVTTDAQVLKTVLVQKGLTTGMEGVKGDKNE
ncbi:MAG: 5-bromo-4-chloroindolyl phosphate hydrolysis family protein [Lachnospiraceae bacterium]|nr:5-bromo-4-chloroindolyl phosphate hydrolysis family protein [Lachnospiraceae bacterium]